LVTIDLTFMSLLHENQPYQAWQHQNGFYTHSGG
jgi:hypothetical protein